MSDHLDTGDVAAGFAKPHDYTVWEDIQGIWARARGAAYGGIVLRGLHPPDLGAGNPDRAGRACGRADRRASGFLPASYHGAGQY